MLALFATSIVGTTIQADGFRYTLIKEQSECNSNDLWLGKRSLKSCAEECARRGLDVGLVQPKLAQLRAAIDAR